MQPLLAQLTLGLRLTDEATFDNYQQGKHSEILSALKKTVVGSDNHIIYLCSPRSSGKSHLLQACCHYAHQCGLSSIYLPLTNLLSVSPQVLTGCEAMQVVCIDDLQTISGHVEWEEAVFYLYNRLLENQCRLIVAANDLPKSLAIKLPDLVSRLSWGVVYQLPVLTDDEKLNILMMRANRRGICLNEETAKYILNHCPRHMGTLFAALDALDKASLAAKRKITIPFVKDILQV